MAGIEATLCVEVTSASRAEHSTPLAFSKYIDIPASYLRDFLWPSHTSRYSLISAFYKLTFYVTPRSR